LLDLGLVDQFMGNSSHVNIMGNNGDWLTKSQGRRQMDCVKGFDMLLY